MIPCRKPNITIFAAATSPPMSSGQRERDRVVGRSIAQHGSGHCGKVEGFSSGFARGWAIGVVRRPYSLCGLQSAYGGTRENEHERRLGRRRWWTQVSI